MHFLLDKGYISVLLLIKMKDRENINTEGRAMARQESIEKFETAMDEIGMGIGEEEMAISREPIDNFIARWGQPHEIENGISIWHNLQVAKGKRCGDLYVMSTEDGTLSYFDGEY